MGFGLLGFSPEEWRGVLGSSTDQLPPQGPTAPMFVPPQQAAPSPPADPSGGILAALTARLAAAHARAMLPEADDHGLSERRKLSSLQLAMNPITSYPETYLRMNREAWDQMSQGMDQLMHLGRDDSDSPSTGSAFDAVIPRGLSNAARGAANVAMGGLGYVTSPINAAYRSLLGQPLEDVMGIPREYTELAAQLATPGIGLRGFTRGSVPPGQTTHVPSGIFSAGSPASHDLPATAPFSPASPTGPLEIASLETRAARELPSPAVQPVSPANEALPTPPNAASAADGSIASTARDLPERQGLMPELAYRYPEIVRPVVKQDENGNLYLAKQFSEEEHRLEPMRHAIQPELDEGKYPPEYDPAKRYPATSNPSTSISDTQEIRMVRAATQRKYDALARSPEARQRMIEAYERGLLQKDNAAYWSDIGQLEKDFIDELGPQLGPKQFKEFVDSIAATTAGNTPTANLLLAHYLRYLKAMGQEMPKNSFELPHPVGGQFAMSNVRRFERTVSKGEDLTPANPKPFNYSHEMLGHYSSPERMIGHNNPPPESRMIAPMIDTRISRLFHPEMDAPPPGSYGHFQSALTDLANELGVDPHYFRDLVWAGASPDHSTKPLIQIINEAIERTHRITGMPRAEVKRGLIRANIPILGAGGMLAAPQLFENDEDRN